MEIKVILVRFTELFLLSDVLFKEAAVFFNPLLKMFTFRSLFGRIVIDVEVTVFYIVFIEF